VLFKAFGVAEDTDTSLAYNMEFNVGSKPFETFQLTVFPGTFNKLDQADIPIVADRPDAHPQRSRRFPFAVTGVYHQKSPL
jgi:hypothetical protein